MEAWLIVFILLCIFYGPIYLMMVAAGYALTAMSNNGTIEPTFRLFIMSVILGLPLIVTGYMAYKRSRYA
jgi:hypothetical protein